MSLAYINIPESARSIDAEAFGTGSVYYDIPWYLGFYDGDSGLHYNNLHGYAYAGTGNCELYRQRCTLECSASADEREAAVTGFRGTADSVVIPAIYDRYRITAIADRAFYGCADLKSITFPSSLEAVGDYAFFKCISLESVGLGSVGTIGLKSFSYCQSLKLITMPAGLEKIGGYAFYGSGLESLTISGNDVSVGKGSFSECKNLSSVSFIGSSAKIGTKAFYNDICLCDLDLSGAASIGFKAFPYCDGLVTVSIPGSIAAVGEYAFFRCAGLNNLIVEEGISNIGRSAFSQCLSLEYVSLPESLGYVGPNAFYGIAFEDPDGNALEPTADLRGHIFTGAERVLRMAKGGEDVPYVILSGSCGENVQFRLDDQGTLTISGIGPMYDYSWGSYNKTLVNGALSYNKSTAPWFEDLGPVWAEYYSYGFADIGTSNAYPIKNIVIEEGVTSVGDYAFCDCCSYDWDIYESYVSSIESVSLPNTLVSIGKKAFSDFRFYDADDKEINTSAESLRGHTFKGSFKNLYGRFYMSDIAEGDRFSVGGIEYVVTSVRNHEISGYVVISVGNPEVSAAGYEGAILEMPSSVLYKGLDIPVTSVAAKVFYGCESLASADLANVSSIGMKAFANCRSLADISFGDGLETVGAYAFYGLTFYDGKTKLQPSPETLGGHAFSGSDQKLFLIS